MRWWQIGKRNADLERELRSDLELEEEEQRERGLSPEEARYAARRAFGNPTLIREHTHEAWGWNGLESLRRDLFYAARTLGRAPGFSLIVVLVMSLGIGATVAMFTVVHSVLMKPLPFQDQGRLVRIYEADAHEPTHNHIAVSGPDFSDWQQQQHSFAQMAIAWNWSSYNLSGVSGQLPEYVHALTASWNMYELLGVKPALGRFFDADDDRPGANAAVVLSWGLWKSRYGGDPKILGQTILLDAKQYTVIGVLPAGSDFPDSTVQLWTPFFHETPPQWLQSHGAHNFQVFARLKPGASVAQAQAEGSAIQAGIHSRFPSQWVSTATHVVPLLQSRVGNIEPALLMLLAATVCLLLIGCLNVSNLLVARSAARRREAAIRTALGGGRWRLVREQLVESVLLCAAGGALGLFLAWMAIRWLLSVHPDIPRVEGIHLDGIAVLAGVGIMLFCGLLAGLIPVLALREKHILGPLQDSTRSQRGGHASAGLRRVLLSLEVALTVVLLVGASLLLKSYQHLHSVNLGCRTNRVLTMGIALPDATYKTPLARTNFYDVLLQRVRALPGVETAALTDALPGVGEPPDYGFFIPENLPLPPGHSLDADVANVDPGYFRTMQIPLVRGRFFQSNERLGQSQFAIVSQSFVRKFLPDTDPIGKHIDFSTSPGFEIVGVVGDVRGAVAAAVEPTIYFPLYRGEENSFSLAVVTGSDPLTVALPIQKTIAEMDPNLAESDILAMDQILSKSTTDASLEAALLVAFAVVSLLLAAVGLFGVLSYLVAQRRGEIGIRLALGAQRKRILQLMLLDGLRPAIGGLVVGMLVSAGVTRLIQSMLYGTSPFDLATFAFVAIMLLIVAAAACSLPAWRASRLDPMQALRTD
ncbi:MAG TPA: ABC transporter permease [Acidobacteriaceae bacterium]|jgi:putative ABC transport system permease protein|nr:ABC transporter permease [Acidobacteriaceae bacterium]